MSDDLQQGDQPGPLTLLAARIGRHTGVYLAASILTMGAGIASVAVLTRYLPPSDYGQYAVLTFFATVLTIIFNAGSLQGTFSWVFGAAGDEGAEIADDLVGAAPDRRRALMTGVVLTAGIGTLGSAVTLAFAGPIADLLLGDGADAQLVVWATLAGATAAVWRLVANSLRLERRPAAYLTATGLLNLLTLGVSWALVAYTANVESAIAGLAIGQAAAACTAVGLARRNMRLAVSWSDAANIMRRGRALIPVVFSFYTIQLADTFLLSRYVSAADVGLYRVAQRVGSVMSYWGSAYNMAWGAMRHDPLQVAADRAHGHAEASSRLALAWTIAATGLTLFIALFADQLVRLAGDGYADAAPLIPFTAVAYAFHALYVVVYRIQEIPNKRAWFVRLSIAAAIVFILSSIALAPPLGGYGVALGAIAGWTVGIAGFVILGQRGPDPVPYKLRQMAGAVALAAACYVLGRALAPDGLLLGTAVDAVAWAAYLLGVVGLGVLPGSGRAAARTLAQSLIPPLRRRSSTRKVAGELSEADRRLVELLVQDERSPDDVALVLGLGIDEIQRDLVRALRHVAGRPGSTEADTQIGSYLLSRESFADREQLAQELWQRDVDPIEVDALQSTLSSLRRRRRRVKPSRDAEAP